MKLLLFVLVWAFVTWRFWAWADRTRPQRKAARDARRIEAETQRTLDALATRAADPDPLSGLDLAELGIGASVFGDLSPGFGKSTGHARRRNGRVFRPAPWLVDDSATYEGTSLVKKHEGRG